MTKTLNIQTSQKPAIGYCRVSTSKQADSGASLAAQQEKIAAMCVVQGLELGEIVVDAGESAKTLGRPGLERVMQLVQAGQVSAVIVHKLDRLTRSVRDLGELLDLFKRKTVSLISISESLDTGSAAGRLVVNIMASVSQWEREAVGERTATALQSMRANGRVYNHTPYGFRREGGLLVELPEEQAVIQRIQFLRAEGSSLRKIAATLNGEGVTGKTGKLWAAKTVLDCLRLNKAEAA